ncbi:meiosis regulator and mRNA stability factor 1-like isoform X1 [Acipenser ruthenus]|uniref:meiosis regulator and mRNA stability factor 1-like isoform X1 n=1 Tax=Acipenser ruthenus TaxID=7906 RepID=UPI0027412C96|nr:meiosis regulator and mRNA stability factor 1-like isoform X1 [Acipenser ruthenus]XP_058851835.1 meiosis regulator and mRNA stability factor 1-like isoform X1 [Acipenser ruthenus]
MMEGMGKERALCTTRPFQWQNHTEDEAQPWLWKLSDCFSSFEQNPLPFTEKPKDYMENRKPVLELKDVPPPPHHTSSKSFPTAPLPNPPSCFQSQQQVPQQMQQQGGANPKVSVCACYEGSLRNQHSGRDAGFVSSSFGGVSGGGVSLHISKPLDPLNASSSDTITCQVGSALRPPLPSLRDVCSQIRGVGCEIQHPTVAASQSIGTHPHLPCCAGLLRQLHPFPTVHSGFGQTKLITAGSSVAAPSHDGFLTSSRYYPCREEFLDGARAEQHFSRRDLATSAHLYTNPLHLNVEHAHCLKGTHYCGECLRKSVRAPVVDTAKVWPNIPPPPTQSVPIPIPMCNGCGIPGTATDGLLHLGTSLGKSTQKYGSPDSENSPPVGVFWDIENCSVPSGRSAVAVVQRIREQFFQGHREAEFICVCDISKENKEVIQELNNCQVTVAHINATAKNAADDKLRQSLRRFADTHASPATVVLVSSDVNFACELSDLRHRHGFQVILVHKNQASDALLQHAHRHVTFEELVSDLPPRVPGKTQPCHTLLYVYNLPTHRDGKTVSYRLRRLSDNCGGKVLSISSGSAVLRFSSQDAAERARKRMENEDVFGNKISISLSPRDKKRSQGEETTAKGPPSSSSSSQAVEKHRSPKHAGRTARLCQSIRDPVGEQTFSPRKGAQAINGSAVKNNVQVKSLQEMCLMESKPKLNYTLDKQSRNETPSPQSNGETTCITSVATKSVGIGESPYIGRRRDSSTPRSVTDSPVEKAEKTSSDFYVSTPSAFSKLNLQRTMSPLILSQGSWSSRSRSGSPCLSNRSSPLTAPTQNPSPCPEATQGPFTNGVDIQVANLDYRMSRKDLQQILHDTFSKHGRVKSVELSPHTDYQLRATVQFGTLQEAIRAVSGLHRYKIGGKRIQVSLVTGNNSRTLALLRSEIITILQDAPACCLPLFKFTEIYEKKFGHKLGVSDLNKLTDTVAVRDQGNSRLVCLLHSSQARQSPLGSSQSHDGSSATCSPVVFEELEYHEPICKQHSTNYDFSESEFDPDSYKIPFVFLSMKTFASQVHGLLQTHEGTVPLLSFPECYASEFSPLKLVEEGEGGVPLEHLITCIPGINIVTAQNGIKVVKWIHNKPPPPNAADPWIQRCKSPVGNPQLIQFSREVVDLMKNQPCCIIPISNFIPTYHHHFAKQCRVSDYGYSKLLELLEAVPHVLQILGMGSKRLLTLTHRAHVKRFTQDLLKLLKSQASKEVVIRDFMQAYHWCFSKDWDVTEYGVCELTDLLAEIPDTTVCVTQEDGDMVISIPKRERTQEEVERTKQFAKEVVDLIRHQPHFRMPFNKFIPSYHHHFGRQCKLTYYGFSKLMELFEAIPEVLLVLECGEEKILALTEVEKVKALAAQFVKLLRSQTDNRILMSDLLAEYGKTFGYGMRLQDFDVSSVPALLQKLCHVVKMVDSPAGREIQLINRKSLRSLTTQLLVLLMSLENPSSHLCIDQLLTQYEAIHGTLLNPCEYGFVSLSELLKSLPYLVEVFVSEEDDVQKECVRLTRLYQFARSVRALLHTYHYQQIFLSEFPSAFSKYTGKGLQHRAYGYSTVEELLGAIPQVVWIKGHGHKKIIVLKNDMKVRSSPSCCPTDSDSVPDGSNLQDPAESTRSTPSPGSSRTDPELLCLSGGSPVDLLCGPVPSCLPSPQLHPDLVLLEHADLIQFEERPSNSVVIQDTLTSDTITPASGTRGVSLTSHVQKPSSPIISQVNKPPPPCTLKGAVTESSAKKTSRNKVKLAANFSFAPVTRL